MSVIDIILLMCATWYVSNSITTKFGPWNIFWHIRDKFSMGGLTHCQHCFSMWAALALILLYGFGLQIIVVCLGVAGGALMLGSYTGVSNDNRIDTVQYPDS